MNKGYDKDGNAIYEIKNGKGFIKEYNKYGEILFEGGYLKGERNGKGKEYNKYGEIVYEGGYLNGKRNGKGKEYFKGELVFEGEFLNGQKILPK